LHVIIRIVFKYVIFIFYFLNPFFDKEGNKKKESSMILDIVSLVGILTLLLINTKKYIDSDKNYGKIRYYVMMALLVVLMLTRIIFSEDW
jgi:uncharacterized membrane protein